MAQPAGFLIDVPIILSVSVRGLELTEEKAKEIAFQYAENVKAQPHGLYSYLQAHAHSAAQVTEATVDPGTLGGCEVLYELPAQEFHDDSAGEQMVARSIPHPAHPILSA